MKRFLVLVDVVMPRIGGAAFVELARRAFPELVLIVMSGHAAVVPYGDGAMPKPVRPAVLVSIVSELISSVLRAC